jgi:hypothetical protein
LLYDLWHLTYIVVIIRGNVDSSKELPSVRPLAATASAVHIKLGTKVPFTKVSHRAIFTYSQKLEQSLEFLNKKVLINFVKILAFFNFCAILQDLPGGEIQNEQQLSGTHSS